MLDMKSKKKPEDYGKGAKVALGSRFKRLKNCKFSTLIHKSC
jgi:hypothetical protein